MTFQVVISDVHPAPVGAQQLESHLMGDDVLEEVPPFHHRAAPVPIADHHLPPRNVVFRGLTESC